MKNISKYDLDKIENHVTKLINLPSINKLLEDPLIWANVQSGKIQRLTAKN
jgi:hypothetical protein